MEDHIGGSGWQKKEQNSVYVNEGNDRDGILAMLLKCASTLHFSEILKFCKFYKLQARNLVFSDVTKTLYRPNQNLIKHAACI